MCVKNRNIFLYTNPKKGISGQIEEIVERVFRKTIFTNARGVLVVKNRPISSLH
jgi:hypothetical protein